MKPLHKKLIDTIACLPKGKYAIAVSGGSDSLALLYLCAEINLEDYVVVHFDHNVRAESAEEAEFVKQTSENLGLKYFSKVWTTEEQNKLTGNFYQQARKARYEFFAKIIKENSLNGVIVAHSKTDLVETLLMRIAKGASLKSISLFKNGTDIYNAKVYRPLLEFSRQDLKNYLIDKNITWKSDPSNKNLKKTRPLIRSILPSLEKAFNDFAGFVSAVEYFNQANDSLDYYTNKELEQFTKSDLGYYFIKQDLFFEKPIEIRVRLINKIIEEYRNNFEHFPRRKNVIELLNRLKEYKTSIEVIDILTIEVFNDNLFIYPTNYSSEFNIKENEAKIRLQELDKKTRNNIIKKNSLEFLPINIRHKVIVTVPKNKPIKELKLSDFSCICK